jgi:hypothetical protein
VAAGLGTAAEHALISLLALNELRVPEATGADIEALGTERGHRTVAITRKGGKKAVIPLAPGTARAIDLGRQRTLSRPSSPPRPASGWTGTTPGGSSAGSPAAPALPRRLALAVWMQQFLGADAATLIADDSLTKLRGSTREMADKLQRRPGRARRLLLGG